MSTTRCSVLSRFWRWTSTADERKKPAGVPAGLGGCLPAELLPRSTVEVFAALVDQIMDLLTDGLAAAVHVVPDLLRVHVDLEAGLARSARLGGQVVPPTVV